MIYSPHVWDVKTGFVLPLHDQRTGIVSRAIVDNDPLEILERLFAQRQIDPLKSMGSVIGWCDNHKKVAPSGHTTFFIPCFNQTIIGQKKSTDPGSADYLPELRIDTTRSGKPLQAVTDQLA